MTLVNQEQNQASNPFDSVWVSASAGTGKTKVLTDRVLRLLLQTSQPDKILCITFTKAAAAEMENRLSNVLKNWATCSETDLIQEIETLTSETPDKDQLQTARRLFAKTLETAGGMKIMTIHSFCQSILKRFPLEADVPPHFEVIDDLIAHSMKEEILNEVLAANDLQNDIQELTYLISPNALLDLLGRILNETPRLFKLTEHYPGSLDSVIYAIKQYFNIQKYQSEKQIINEICLEEKWEETKQEYLTKADTVRDKKKDEEKAYQVFDTQQKLLAFQTTKATQTLLKIAMRVVEEYQNLKNKNALLDYADLINKTNNLLSKSSMTSWVLYKLDGGIDHILVDEAQDTNKEQWEIIKAISEEFFSGEGRSDYLRTLFVVGDKKQSIYSFQGADPFAFEQMRHHFEQRIIESQNTFKNVMLNYSFRSTEPVLRLVNYLLENEQAKNGVLFNTEQAYHLTNRTQDAGLVEIWPPEEPQKTDKPDPWKPPVERQENESAMKRLINKIADKIESLIGKEFLPSQNRLIEPKDILILLQKRSTMMSEIVRTLRQRQIPIAGVDRLALSNHLAIQDLIALTEFVLQPSDDLNLANLIKSPIINLKETDLYQICVNRENQTVWHQMQKKHPEQANILKEITNLADKTPPFEFYSTILGALNMRQKFIARFGEEVNEALDEFLNLVLKFEQTNTPSLQLFLNWFLKHEIEIKRDLDNSETNAVRIMTVHGSKGLQGNIVFLPDTRSGRSGNTKGGELIWLNDILPIWIPNAAMRPSKIQDLLKEKKKLDYQERRRLLYVALTRASDRLYICGFGKPSDNNWYDLILNALPQEIQPDKNGIIKWQSEQQKQNAVKTYTTWEKDYEQIPDWAMKNPPEETPIQRPISPSKLGENDTEDPIVSANDKQQELALKRGTFLHYLLQLLPTIPMEKRLETAQKLCPKEIELPSNLMEIFTRPILKDLVGENSLAEVPVIGTIENQVVSGQIDRLIITPTEVKIVDFKTNRIIPKKVPQTYKKQLEAYKHLLKDIFPDKIIRTYILWTQTLFFEEIE